MGNNDYLLGAGTPPHWGLCLYLDAITSCQWSVCIVVPGLFQGHDCFGDTGEDGVVWYAVYD